MATSVFGISLIRDEVDIVEQTVRRMREQVDHVMVLDNGSRDGTREILEQLGVEVFDDPDPAHYQSRKMSWLAQRAGERGAEWVVPFDADEAWRARNGTIKHALAALPPEILIAEATLFDHVATARDREDAPPLTRMVWRRVQPTPMRKVACRVRPGLVIHEGNHSASYPGVKHPPAALDALVVRHFPYRSADQFVKKVRNGAAALNATNLPEGIGKHWRDYGRLLDARGPEAIHEVFFGHFWSADPENDERLVLDPCP